MKRTRFLKETWFLSLAEGVGFEPTVAIKTTTVFETVPFVHSGTLPRVLLNQTQ